MGTVSSSALHAVVYPRESSYKKRSTGSSAMDRPHPSLLKVAVTAIAVCFSICGAAAPLALEDALTASGDAFFDASEYAKAEASYNEALQLAERNAGLESERVLGPLLGLSKTLAASGRHQQAVPRLQRALAIQRSQYGLFDLRQQDTLKTLAASLTALDRTEEAQDLMIYRVRTAEKNYGEANLKVIPAVCDLGNWFAEVGMSAEARMTFQ